MPGTPDERRIPRQRWRLRYERDRSAAGLTQREEADTWIDALSRSGLPIVTAGEPPRPRLSLGPPLPSGCLALDEPLEILLYEQRPVHEVRTALETVTPDGHLVTGLYDVWLGAPALQAAGRAVDYAIQTEGVPPHALGAAASALLAANELPRERLRGTRTVQYDLRPLIERIEVEPAPGRRLQADGSGAAIACLLRFRGRLDPDRGVVRPDELIAALAERLAVPIVTTAIVRTNVWLAGDTAPTGTLAGGV